MARKRRGKAAGKQRILHEAGYTGDHRNAQFLTRAKGAWYLLAGVFGRKEKVWESLSALDHKHPKSTARFFPDLPFRPRPAE